MSSFDIANVNIEKEGVIKFLFLNFFKFLTFQSLMFVSPQVLGLNFKND